MNAKLLRHSADLHLQQAKVIDADPEDDWTPEERAHYADLINTAAELMEEAARMTMHIQD